MADALAHEILLLKWQRTGFPENLSTFTARIADALPDESRQKVDELLERRETGPFDTHPAPRERVCSVEREPAEGIFRWDLPASRLFADFDRLAAELTYETYQAAFGPLMSPDQLLPLDTFWERAELEMS